MDEEDTRHRSGSGEMGRNSSEEEEPTVEETSPSASLRNHPLALPDDLPKSLDDRRLSPVFRPETEMYDAWQGQYDHDVE